MRTIKQASGPAATKRDPVGGRTDGPFSAPKIVMRINPFLGVATLGYVLVHNGTTSGLTAPDLAALVLGTALVVTAPLRGFWRAVPAIARPLPAALALGLAGAPTSASQPATPGSWTMFAFLVALPFLVTLMPWGRVPRAVESTALILSLIPFVLIRALMHTDELLLFPLWNITVLFIALYGSRAETWGGILMATVVFWLPIPGDQVGFGEVVQDVMLTGMILVMALSVFEVVSASRRKGSELLVSTSVARRSSAMTNAVLENTADGLVTADETGTITNTNRAARSLFGVSEADMLGRALKSFVVGRKREEFAASLDRISRDEPGDHGRVLEQTTGLRGGRGFAMEYDVSEVQVEGGRVFIVALRDISKRKAHLETMERQALYDGLTGLPNRALFEDRFGQALKRAARQHGRATLMLLDLNGFKGVNDGHGHQAGDLVLKEVGKRLVNAVRGSDTVARLGGDEFVVLPGPVRDGEALRALGRKLVRSISEPVVVEGRRVEVGVSIGIAIYPEHGTDHESLMRAADGAMYAAKREGSGCEVAASPEVAARTA